MYSLLGSLTSAVASLHHLAAFHDGAAKKGVWATGDSRAGRAVTFQVSWELHLAGKILHQVSEPIANVHNAERTDRDLALAQALTRR